MDQLIDGGFNEGDVILIAGQPGAGKSTLGMQFIYNGISVHNQAGVYASFVESATKLKRDMLGFGWDLDNLEQGGKLTVLDLVQLASERGVEANLAELLSSISKLHATRLVVDSLSAIMKKDLHSKDARSRPFLGLLRFLYHTRRHKRIQHTRCQKVKTKYCVSKSAVRKHWEVVG